MKKNCSDNFFLKSINDCLIESKHLDNVIQPKLINQSVEFKLYKGYNFIQMPFGSNYMVLSGSIIGCLSTNLSLAKKSEGNFYIRVFISRPQVVSIYHQIFNSGSYLIRATSLINNNNIQSKPTKINVIQPIKNVSILISNSYNSRNCAIKIPCSFTPIIYPSLFNVSVDTNISFTWTFILESSNEIKEYKTKYFFFFS